LLGLRKTGTATSDVGLIICVFSILLFLGVNRTKSKRSDQGERARCRLNENEGNSCTPYEELLESGIEDTEEMEEEEDNDDNDEEAEEEKEYSVPPHIFGGVSEGAQLFFAPMAVRKTRGPKRPHLPRLRSRSADAIESSLCYCKVDQRDCRPRAKTATTKRTKDVESTPTARSHIQRRRSSSLSVVSTAKRDVDGPVIASNQMVYGFENDAVACNGSRIHDKRLSVGRKRSPLRGWVGVLLYMITNGNQLLPMVLWQEKRPAGSTSIPFVFSVLIGQFGLATMALSMYCVQRKLIYKKCLRYDNAFLFPALCCGFMWAVALNFQ